MFALKNGVLGGGKYSLVGEWGAKSSSWMEETIRHLVQTLKFGDATLDFFTKRGEKVPPFCGEIRSAHRRREKVIVFDQIIMTCSTGWE